MLLIIWNFLLNYTKNSNEEIDIEQGRNDKPIN